METDAVDETNKSAERALATADAIVNDLRGRGGLRGVWDEIDDRTKDEIRGSWAGLVAVGPADGTYTLAEVRGAFLRKFHGSGGRRPPREGGEGEDALTNRNAELAWEDFAAELEETRRGRG